MERLVVGVDGSDGSRAALRWAVDEAKIRDAVVDVVMAWDYPAMGAFAIGVGMASSEEFERDTRAVVEAMLTVEGLAESDRLRIVVGWGPAAPLLLEHADGAELVVVGSRGRGAFAGMLLGSVSLHVATHAHGPVVVVPPMAADDGGSRA